MRRKYGATAVFCPKNEDTSHPHRLQGSDTSRLYLRKKIPVIQDSIKRKCIFLGRFSCGWWLRHTLASCGVLFVSLKSTFSFFLVETEKAVRYIQQHSESRTLKSLTRVCERERERMGSLLQKPLLLYFT